MNQRVAAGLFGFLSAIGAAVLVADPTTLGLPAVAVAWIGIAMAGLSFLQMFLGPVHKNGAAE